MTRAAVYLRISRDDARLGLAVERQRSECLALIKKMGLELAQTYTDNAVSAYARRVTRPAFDAMTKDYESGKFDVVVAWDIDRFSRQPVQMERWIEMGESRGLQIITPTEVTDLGTDNGRMFARIKLSVARAEVERKSARQKAQVEQAKESGIYRHRLGFNDPDVIKRIFSMALDGDGVYKIAQTLNADGLTTLAGKAWTGQSVKAIVARTPRHRGTLIPADDYDKAVALVSRGVRVGPKSKGRFSGVARCTCGAAMTASGDRYVCSYATNAPGLTGHQVIARHHLESQIDAAMVSAFAFGREDLAPKTADVTSFDMEIAKVAEARGRLIKLVKSDLATQDEIEPELRSLKQHMDSLDKQRTTALAENAHATMLDGLTATFLTPGVVEFDSLIEHKKALTERWEAMDPDKRRDLAREFLAVTVTPGRGAGRVNVHHRVVNALNETEAA